MNLSPAISILGALYGIFSLALAALAIYALVVVIIFLRLRIAELKGGAPPKSGPLR